MKNKSRQEVFDHVVNALRKQGRKALFDGVCAYRAPGGLKCAAGHLISDEAYSPDIEKFMIDWGVISYYNSAVQALLNSGITAEDLPLVRTLQNIHDDFAVDEWENEWKRTASKFGLEYKHETASS